ncbi:MAG: ribose-phosphate diphosphokinase [Candidatus Bathyarchaeia archaeon]
MIIIPGSASKDLGIKVAKMLNVELVPIEHKIFPDGESYIRFTNDLKNNDAVIIQSCSPPQDKNLIELFLMLDNAKDLGAKSITAIVPYLAYSRQDKRFMPFEAISIKTIAKLIESIGIDEIITFDIHSLEILKNFKIKAMNFSAMSLLGKYFLNLGLKDPLVIAPDKGAQRHAEAIAKILNSEYTFLEKHRNRVSGEVITFHKNLNVKNKDVIIIDDIISTGSTIANASKIAKNEGAKDIYVGCTHPLLIGDARKKLKDSGVKKIVGTDCIINETSEVSVAPIIVEYLRKKL